MMVLFFADSLQVRTRPTINRRAMAGTSRGGRRLRGPSRGEPKAGVGMDIALLALRGLRVSASPLHLPGALTERQYLVVVF